MDLSVSTIPIHIFPIASQMYVLEQCSGAEEAISAAATRYLSPSPLGPRLRLPRLAAATLPRRNLTRSPRTNYASYRSPDLRGRHMRSDALSIRTV